MDTSSWIGKCRQWLSGEPERDKPLPIHHSRPAVELLEERVVLDVRRFAGLEFLALTPFTTDSGRVSVDSRVLVGLAPKIGRPFTPLLEVEKGVAFNPAGASTTFATAGTVKAVVSGQSIALFDDHLHAFSAADLLSEAGFTLPFRDINTTRVPVDGIELKPTSLALGRSEIILHGTASFPGVPGARMMVSGANKVVIDGAGSRLVGPQPIVSLLVQPANFTFEDATLRAQRLTATHVPGSGNFILTGHATISIADLITRAPIELGGNGTAGLILHNGTVSELHGSIQAPVVTVSGASLLSTNLILDYQASSGEFSLSGGARLQIPGVKQRVGVQLGSKQAPGIHMQKPGFCDQGFCYREVSQFDFSVNSGQRFTLDGLPIRPKSLSGSFEPDGGLYHFKGSAEAGKGRSTDIDIIRPAFVSPFEASAGEALTRE